MLEILVALIPLMLLLAALLLGHYPGCEAIIRLSDWLARVPDIRRSRGHRRPTSPRRHAIGACPLIASGHAQRPPPLAL